MATITVFVSSLGLIAIIVTLKAVEIKYKKSNFFFKLLKKSDSLTDELIAKFKFTTLQLIQSARYIVLVEIKEICKNILEKIEKKITDEYRAKQLIIMGYRNIPNGGSASFFLKKIHEEKQNTVRGKIEESL